jgi:hypothetical protein
MTARNLGFERGSALLTFFKRTAALAEELETLPSSLVVDVWMV